MYFTPEVLGCPIYYLRKRFLTLFCIEFNEIVDVL